MNRPPSKLGTARTSTLATEIRTVIAKLKRRLREQAPPGDLSWSQVAVLGFLESNSSTTVSALARAENMRSQSMGAIVATLEEAELISSAPDPVDGRQAILSLSEKCREWIKTNRMAREDWLFQAVRTKFFSPQEQRSGARRRIAEADSRHVIGSGGDNATIKPELQGPR
jgi:DNA-binding MarR family transcriptional regulator